MSDKKELKTLKDCYRPRDDHLTEDVLRDAAREWIKELEKGLGDYQI